MTKLFTSAALIFALILLCSCGEKDESIYTPEGKKILYLVRMGSDSTVVKAVDCFNMNNDEYYIETIDCNSTDKMLIDIAAEKRIDLIELGVETDYDAFIGKGVLLDLYELMDSDEEVSRESYNAGVLNACEKNGKLYNMPFYFYIRTAVGKADIWGDDRDVSIQHLTEKSREMNCIYPVSGFCGARNNITNIFSVYVNEFVDPENGTCCFDDGRFKGLIDFIALNSPAVSAEGDDDPDEIFGQDKSLLYYTTLGDFSDLDYMETKFGSKIIFRGLPSDTENYHIMEVNYSFGINSKSKEKEGAFEFIKYYSSYNYQMNNLNFFPVNQQLLDDMCKYAPDSEFISTDRYGVRVEYKCTKENAEKIMEQINTCSDSVYTHYSLYEIMAESTMGYRNGTETAEEACADAQTRTEIYLSERYE